LGEDPIGFDSNDYNFYRYVRNSPINLIDANGKSPTSKWIDCGGGCKIRIDNNHAGDGRHIHWECKGGKSGACGENNTISHGTNCSGMPRKIKKCAKKHGFNPDPIKKPDEQCQTYPDIIPAPPPWLVWPARVAGTLGAIGGAILAP